MPALETKVLEVADKHLRPIHKIERAIRRDGDTGGTNIRVLRDVIRHQILDGLALDAGALFRKLGAENPLHADHVGVEEKPLPIVREVAAGEDRRAGARARRAIPEPSCAPLSIRWWKSRIRFRTRSS